MRRFFPKSVEKHLVNNSYYFTTNDQILIMHKKYNITENLLYKAK
ncbi:hypothetical protein L579_2627 [Pantoea sp. AS-PWVM4]|nr:hypothetical protein L579_2627 [Pantoea sp. AS-PWVM4]